MNTEFYLTLLSNSSMNYFPGNTTTSFMTQLPKRIKLIGDWVVGVSEIQYPCSLLSVSEGENLLYYRTQPPPVVTNVDEVLEKAGKYFTQQRDHIAYVYDGWNVFKISSGNYESIHEVVSELNSHELISKLFRFSYNKVTKRVSIKVHASLALVGFSRRLSLQLGYAPDDDGLSNLKSSILSMSTHPSNIWSGIPSQMFIYCDLVEPQLVGDSLSPLLRITNISSDGYNYGCYKDVVFSPVHYVPVLRKEFENMEVNIRTETGTPMPFEFGTLNLKLHFKKIK